MTSTDKEIDDYEYGISSDTETGVFRTHPVKYAIIDGRAIFEGDIDLGAPEQLRGLQFRTMGVGIAGEDYRWHNAVVPYMIDAGLPDQARVTDAITHWETNTSIRFVERTASNKKTYPDFVTFLKGGGCSSSVGRQGGEQFIKLANGCSTGNAIHEIGHAIGLWHEQSRRDRESFVKIDSANIKAHKSHNFDQHINDGDELSNYDYGSIMHYGAKAFSKNGLPTITTRGGQKIGQRKGLSAGDIASVLALYPEKMIEHPSIGNNTNVGPDISIGADGTVWSTGEPWYPKLWNGSAWEKKPGGVQRLAVGPDGKPWAIGSNWHIYQWQGKDWVERPSPPWGRDIGIGADGSVWIVGFYRPFICKWNGTGWDKTSYDGVIDGYVSRIAVGPDGNPWMVNGKGDIYRLVAGKFEKLPGTGTDIGVGADGSVWLLGKNKVIDGFSIYKLSASNKWVPMGGGGVGISVGPNGVPWVVTSGGKVFERAL